MQASQQKSEHITPEEYLATERGGLEKHEFYQGECFAMAGASRWHNLLAGRVFAALLQHLEGKPCTPYMADMRLHIEAQQHYVYPDVMVVCEEEAYVADDMVNDATIIIEILSPTAELYDRGRKFLHYQSVPSLREYVLISQDVLQVEIFRWKADGKWEYERFTHFSDILTFSAVQYYLGLEELYRSIPLKNP
jgi:Uma2 family endonuclease